MTVRPRAASIRVLLAEDQTMLRGALAALLDLEPDIAVIAQAANGREALKLARHPHPTSSSQTSKCPRRTGLELAARSQARRPSRASSSSPPSRAPAISAAHLRPVPAVISSKTAQPPNSPRPFAASTAGLRAIDPALAAEAWSADDDPLSDRERQILQRAGEGRSTAEIAAALRLSEGTVRNYLSEAIAKLGAANRIDAARIARTRGWL